MAVHVLYVGWEGEQSKNLDYSTYRYIYVYDISRS